MSLITDLNMPNPSDGFTVVSAMRHSQPDALTLLVSGYPDVQSAMSAILLEADEIIVKPFETGRLVDLLRDKLLTREPTVRTPKGEGGCDISHRCTSEVVEGWLAKVKKSKELNSVSLGDQERTGYLPKLIEDLIMRLRELPTPPEKRAIPSVPPLPSHTGGLREVRKATHLPCWCTILESCK